MTPYSFSLVCYKDSFILFDSHSHGTAGALLARVPVVYGRAYLQHFFLTYYPALDFNEKNASIAAHVTFLGIMLDALLLCFLTGIVHIPKLIYFLVDNLSDDVGLHIFLLFLKPPFLSLLLRVSQ